jgi:hypothetical protein
MLRNLGLMGLLTVAFAHPVAGADDQALIGHWKLAGDAQDSSGHGHHGLNHGADFSASGPDGRLQGAANFDGKGSFIEVPASAPLRLGTSDFTLAIWAYTDHELDDVLGDIASKYDVTTRRGFNWCIKNGAGMTTSQANYRNVHFGIDDGRGTPSWVDCGRPGEAVYVMAMAVHDGRLFVGTCEPGAAQAGHVYRYDGGTRWLDCGSPDRCNAVTSLAVWDGALYAGVGRYRLAGSSLPESPNAALGGKVYRYEADGQWADCGQLPSMEAIGGMAVYRGRLYAS